MRDDFYHAALEVVRLAGDEPLDNWAVAEFPYCQTAGKPLLVYVDGLSAQTRSNIGANLAIPLSEINGIDGFRHALPPDLRHRLGLP